MAEQVDGVAAVRDKVGKQGTAQAERSGKHSRQPRPDAGDNIEISEEARDRAAGRHRKTILEYLEEENQAG